MSRTRRSNKGKGELWSRRASNAAVNGTYNARWVKKVTNHKERRRAHVETARAVREEG